MDRDIGFHGFLIIVVGSTSSFRVENDFVIYLVIESNVFGPSKHLGMEPQNDDLMLVTVDFSCKIYDEGWKFVRGPKLVYLFTSLGK